MDDISSKLSEILNNPESLNKIKSLSGLLSQNSENKNSQNNSNSMLPNSSHDISADTMNTIMKVMPIISSINKEDESTKFLLALKPLLGNERKKKIDQSIRMLQMMRIIPLLKNTEFFSS